ncbi:MAG: hypothetical protein Q7S27_00855 [Nanoarchaeota archaeon]|nr:hypothetical protein [Nanoarchaeota archaeon]
MKKRMIGFLALIMLATFGNAIENTNVDSLIPVCNTENNDCKLINDIISGACRDVIFSTYTGEIAIMACEKDTGIELYRKSAPEGLSFKACLGSACIDEVTGFDIINGEFEMKQIVDSLDNNVESLSFSSIASDYPLSINDLCGTDQTCMQVLDRWNTASWNDLVDEDFSFKGDIAAVRWYKTEGQCTGEKCENQLHNGNGKCSELSVSGDKFCGVTDEFGNVLLSHSMGSNREKYDKLHRFSEKLRHPAINNLQCWMYYVNGKGDYENYKTLCASSDSASDASIRILGAYSIACAKQRAGIWNSEIDYCEDYLEQGKAIWGLNGNHGEVKYIASSDKYFLCNGYNNQVNCPTAVQSFRPDYYELQFLYDFAEYIKDSKIKAGVIDMLRSYKNSLGDNFVHSGKTGSFSENGVDGFKCNELCSPAYVDNIDSWRAIPALSGLYAFHKEDIPSDLGSIFTDWWKNYGGGNSQYGALNSKPYEIYSTSGSGKVKYSEDSYKTLSMWIPLGSAFNSGYVKEAVGYLVDKQYDKTKEQFNGAAYYGGYFSQFAQRAIGVSTGMIDPEFWAMGKERSLIINTTNVSAPSLEPNATNQSIIKNNSLNFDIKDLSKFPFRCMVPLSYCNLLSDIFLGGCRTLTFKSGKGEIQTKTCMKEDGFYEIYSQKKPSGDYEACTANGCVSQKSGFMRFKVEGNTFSVDIFPIPIGNPSPSPSPTLIPTPIPTSIQLLNLASLQAYCTVVNSYCNKAFDETKKGCRFVTFNSNKGNILLQACDKGSAIEIYRNQFPSGSDFKACLGTACVDQNSGFAKLIK